MRIAAPIISALALGWSFAPGKAPAAPRPNVLFIVIDDMNDGITLFGEDRPFKTPNIEKLAKRGVFFSRHGNDPNECKNLALDPAYRDIIKEHAKWMPTTNTKPYGDLK